MKFKNLYYLIISILIFGSFATSNLFGNVSYEVQFEGSLSPEITYLLTNTSQVASRSDKQSETMIALKRHAEADVKKLVAALHSLAYYGARVDFELIGKQEPVKVVFHISTGPVYPLASFQLIDTVSGINCEGPLKNIPLSDLGITLNGPAFSSNIVEAEDLLLQILSKKGYPLAKIKQREVVADQKLKSIQVRLYIDNGPQAIFGETTILGQSTTEDELFQKKIEWKAGDVFDPEAVERTQEALETCGLFRSVTINYQDTIEADGSLPMTIQVVEGKHRTIGAGIGYATSRGPGASFEWDHRNFRGIGDKVRFRTNMWKDTQQASLAYIISDFGRKDQDLIWLADVTHETTEGYTDTSASFSGTIDRKINENTRFSYGGLSKYISSTQSNNNGDFLLLKTPMQLRWTTANDLMDPTFGQSLNLKVSPTLQVLSKPFAYCTSTLTGTFYHPITSDNSIVLAGKATFGSIIGASRNTLPPSERFYAGNENTLRGYRYMTVSPLGKDHKPIGGRSLMVYSLEARFRLTEKIGLVGFYEIGNVYSSPYPDIREEVLQSTGVGLRYHTPVGPIRLDFAVPLNKRKHVDNDYQIYFSIGQSF